MSAHPYRKATLTAPETPRRGLRAALRDVLNRNAIGAWASVELCDVQAVRRALGGRWALVHARPSEALHPPLTWPRKVWLTWVAVAECPARWPLVAGDGDRAKLHNETRRDHMARCSCEVWP